MDAKKRFVTRIYKESLNGINYITVPSKINSDSVYDFNCSKSDTKASLNGINYITVPSKINSDSVYDFNCSKSDTCVNGSKLRGICKIKLNEKNCKSYEEILGYSITFDF